SRAPEDRLQLLDDLAVAPDGAVEALQVAVDDEDQVVEALSGRDRQAVGALGLVHLAVAYEAPHLGPARVGALVVEQVPVEACLRDRVDRAEAHRDRGELPEVGQPAGVRVARQAAPDLLTEPVEIRFGHPALEEGPGVDTRRRVALHEDLVAEAAVAL